MRPLGTCNLLYLFEDFSLDTGRRELRRGAELVSVEPKIFDLIEFLIRNRDRVVSRDDLIKAVWSGRIVSESALSSSINAARSALDDSGEGQRLIRTLQRKGVRFVGTVREKTHSADGALSRTAAARRVRTSRQAVDCGPTFQQYYRRH